MQRLYSVIILFLSLNSPAFAQQDTIFRSLTASQVDNGVLINFTIRGGITCTGVKIERSTDGVNFIVIHEIAGVCGAIATDESYSFTDKNPVKNKESFYRLDLGSLGLFSKIVSVRFIDYGLSGLAIFPNPCIDRCTIYFSNLTGDELEVLLFNRIGQLVVKEIVSESTWQFQANRLTPGMYYIRVTRKNESQYTSKLVIL
jgi:hypothetical protein